MKSVILKSNKSQPPKNEKQSKIKSELRTTLGKSLYNGWSNDRTLYGYHSYNIGDVNIVGQRNPKTRLDEFRKHINFEGKNVLDFGCNVGAFFSGISTGSLHGWVWFAAAFAGSVLGVRLRSILGFEAKT